MFSDYTRDENERRLIVAWQTDRALLPAYELEWSRAGDLSERVL